MNGELWNLFSIWRCDIFSFFTVRGYIPNSPQDLQYELGRDKNNRKYSVNLVWSAMNNPNTGTVHSYRVIWGPRLREPIDVDLYGKGITPLLDTTRAESKVVDGVRIFNRFFSAFFFDKSPTASFILVTTQSHASQPQRKHRLHRLRPKCF